MFQKHDFISYMTKNMCMKLYSEYFYVIKFMYHITNLSEMVWMAAIKTVKE
jgi:hypothetical protein